jgi:hypothetical protein
MAESLPLTESVPDISEDTLDMENQSSDSESDATRKRKIRSSTGTPSPHNLGLTPAPSYSKVTKGYPHQLKNLASKVKLATAPF